MSQIFLIEKILNITFDDLNTISTILITKKMKTEIVHSRIFHSIYDTYNLHFITISLLHSYVGKSMIHTFTPSSFFIEKKRKEKIFGHKSDRF